MKNGITKYLLDGLAVAAPKALAVTVLVLVMPGDQKGQALGMGAIIVALELLFQGALDVATDVIKHNQYQGTKDGKKE